GVDAVIDAAVMEDDIVPAVKDGGTIITIRGAKGERDRGVTMQAIWVVDYAKEQAKLDELRRQVEADVLTLRVAEVLQMEDAAEAHRKMEAGGIRGRIVLEFGVIPWT